MIRPKEITIASGRKVMDAAAALYGAACRGWRTKNGHLPPGPVCSVPMPFPTWSKPHLAAPRIGNWTESELPEQQGVRWSMQEVFQGNPLLFWAGFGQDGHPAPPQQSVVAIAIDGGCNVVVFRRDAANPKAWEPVPFLGRLDSSYALDGGKPSGDGAHLTEATIKRVGRKLLLVFIWRLGHGGDLSREIADTCLEQDERTTHALHRLGKTALEIAQHAPRAVAPVEGVWDPSLWPAFLPRCMFDAASFLSLVESLRALATILHHQKPNVASIGFTPRTESNVAYVYGAQSDGNLSAILERLEPGSTTKVWQIHSTGQYVRLLPACSLTVLPETSAHGILRARAALHNAGFDPANDILRQ